MDDDERVHAAAVPVLGSLVARDDGASASRMLDEEGATRFAQGLLSRVRPAWPREVVQAAVVVLARLPPPPSAAASGALIDLLDVALLWRDPEGREDSWALLSQLTGKQGLWAKQASPRLELLLSRTTSFRTADAAEAALKAIGAP